MSEQNFKVDTSDYMGFKYEEYLNELMAIAMSDPKKYYKMRVDTLKALKQGIITQVYTTYDFVFLFFFIIFSGPDVTQKYD